MAGKLRRYHHGGLLSIINPKTIYFNIRDFFKTIFGIIKAFFILKKIKPDVVFVKGGYISVPVGLSAAMLKIPYVTHDSDILPGLANRVISKWAAAHAVAMPAELYNYPKAKTFFTGVPLMQEYTGGRLTKNGSRNILNIPTDNKVVFIAGGGLGATIINQAVYKNLADLLKDEKLYIIHQTGEKNLSQSSSEISKLPPSYSSRYMAAGFINNMWDYLSAADVVVTRAGATTIAECSALSKPIILVPNPYLTGGHQSKNAEHLVSEKAALEVNEADIDNSQHGLVAALNLLINDLPLQQLISKNLHNLAKPNATRELAALIISNAKNEAFQKK